LHVDGDPHPADAHPDNAGTEDRPAAHRAAATVLTAPEKQRLWPAIQATIPQMATYVRRTDRDIRVFRLTRTSNVR